MSSPPTADSEVSELFPAFYLQLFVSVKELFFQASFLKIKFVPFLLTAKRRAKRPKFDKFRQTRLVLRQRALFVSLAEVFYAVYL